MRLPQTWTAEELRQFLESLDANRRRARVVRIPLPGETALIAFGVLAAAPTISRDDFRPRSAGWRSDPDGFEAWKEGRTGYPLVDAGMRQLLREGFMHKRARLVAGSFLTKHLSIDWRHGAAHFYAHLVDGDVANNAGNWQWVAGTGTDTRPNRMLNPIRQQHSLDPDGVYARRYLPELGTAEYPKPLIAHEDALARFRWSNARDRSPSP